MVCFVHVCSFQEAFKIPKNMWELIRAHCDYLVSQIFLLKFWLGCCLSLIAIGFSSTELFSGDPNQTSSLREQEGC